MHKENYFSNETVQLFLYATFTSINGSVPAFNALTTFVLIRFNQASTAKLLGRSVQRKPLTIVK